MRWSGIGLVLLASIAHANDVGRAIWLIEKSKEEDIVRGTDLVIKLGPKAKRAAPALVQLLADERSDIRARSRRALFSIGSAATLALIRGVKKTADLTHRRAIAGALAEQGKHATRHFDDILRLLGDPDDQVREALARLLASGGDAAVRGVTRLMGDRNANKQDGAAQTLAAMDAIGLRVVTTALRDKKPRVRACAVAALGYMGPKAPANHARRLVPMARDSEAVVRIAVARALERLVAVVEETVPTLVGLLADADSPVREAAIVSLVRIGESAAEELVAALNGKASAGAERALLGMGRRAFKAVEAGLGSNEASVREGSLRVLGQWGPFLGFGRELLRPLLADDAAAVRRAAAVAIEDSGPPSADTVQALVGAAQDPDPAVRVAVLRALRHAGSSDAVLAAVKSAAEDKEPAVKLAAAATLWDLGQPSDVIELARAMLAGEDAQGVDAACVALARMGRAAADAIPDLVGKSETHASVALVDALGAFGASHGVGLLGRAARYKHADLAARGAIDRALDWLGRFQDRRDAGQNKRDGRWHPTQFVRHAPPGAIDGAGRKHYSAGVTGLAISAFLAVGRTTDPAVAEGLAYLLSAQQSDGVFSTRRSKHFLIDHAIATVAMCEAWILTGDPRYRRSAQAAIDMCVASRNFRLGWRYLPRGGENDTNVTVNMLWALALAERGGLEVDPAAFVGGGQWLQRMTRGDIGYNVPGGGSARPEGLHEKFDADKSGSMSAAGLWGYALVERHGIKPPELKWALMTCRDLMPLWKGARIDMYYWYWGTLTFHERQGKDWKKWYAELGKALIPNQRTDPNAAAGSWDPVGPWGRDGGRVYSTALNALSLATPIRMSRKFIGAQPNGVHAVACNALAKLLKHEDPGVRARAKIWLRRAGR